MTFMHCYPVESERHTPLAPNTIDVTDFVRWGKGDEEAEK